MAPHSSTLAWKLPRTEEPGGLQSMGSAKSWTQLSDFPFTFHFHALEKEMATHSSVLARRIPGMGEPGGLPSMGSHRVGHNWSTLAAAAYVYISIFMYNMCKSSHYAVYRTLIYSAEVQLYVNKNGKSGIWVSKEKIIQILPALPL